MTCRLGITVSCKGEKHILDGAYVRAVWEAGGVPFLLPASPGLAAKHLEHLDGIILSGGGDLDPWLYGEEPDGHLGQVTPDRDAYELELVREARRRHLPVLGICRGIQAMAVAFGGSLHQDLRTQVKHWQEAPSWYPTHGIQMMPGSRLQAILGATEARVNSYHHQAVHRLPPDFAATAFAPDGVIEAIEGPAPDFLIGVQWHPEEMADRYPLSARLFRALVEEGTKRGGGS